MNLPKLPIKFRGRVHSSEYNTVTKFVYGGYYEQDGKEYIITKDAMWRVTNVSQLVGCDSSGKEVYTGDVLLDRSLNEYVARLGDSRGRLARLHLVKKKGDK